MSTKPKRVLILSIHQEHADRIFEGTKRYELRKALPRKQFDRVYLNESGGRGIVGCFDVPRVLRATKQDLWELVGAEATTEERFFEYFFKYKHGCAIEVSNPVRFSRSLNPRELKAKVEGYTAPQSFLLVEHDEQLFKLLERRRATQLEPRCVKLKLIRKREHDAFRELVRRYVFPSYDELSDKYCDQLLESHRSDSEVTGFLTERKRVYAVLSERGVSAGFVVLTYKLGGSLKTGPTLLHPKFQGQGYGKALRSAVEEIARDAGLRKVYCTCPDNRKVVINYLLGAGYRIEAHLENHYAARHGDLVFGKHLVQTSAYNLPPSRHHANSASVARVSDFGRGELIKRLQKLFTASWFPVGRSFAERIVEGAVSDTEKYEEKPKHLILLRSGNKCVGAAILLPKRGGALKAMCMSETAHGPSINRLLDAVEAKALELGRRKLYFLHQAADIVIVKALRQRFFEAEGILREPYAPGQDVIVLAKFLKVENTTDTMETQDD